MYCPHCAAPVEEGVTVCPQCEKALPKLTAEIAPAAPVIKDHLILNIILLAVACLWISCMPALATGILGVVFSAQVKPLVKDGKLDEAQEKSKWAKNLAIATGALIGATLLFLIAYFVFFFAIYGLTFGAMFAEIFSSLSMLAM